MRVLVTGGAGYIGAHACKALALAGHDPIAFDNLRTGHRRAVKWGPLEHGDLLDPAALARAFRTHRPDAVMHFAALAYVGESIAHPDLYYRTNVAGTLNLLDATRAAEVSRFVFSSTCATYGQPDKVPIVETTPQRPVSPYGRSKLMVEHVLADTCRAFGLGAVALRYFNAAGADPDGEIGEDHEPETHLIPLVLQAAAGLQPAVRVFGSDWPTPDGTCIRDYIHVSDLADAHVAAIGRIAPGRFDAFNLGVGKGASIREVIAAARHITGRSIVEEAAPRRAGDPPELIADASAASKALGWTPKRPQLETMIETAWAWQSNPNKAL